MRSQSSKFIHLSAFRLLMGLQHHVTTSSTLSFPNFLSTKLPFHKRMSQLLLARLIIRQDVGSEWKFPLRGRLPTDIVGSQNFQTFSTLLGCLSRHSQRAPKSRAKALPSVIGWRGGSLCKGRLSLLLPVFRISLLLTVCTVDPRYYKSKVLYVQVTALCENMRGNKSAWFYVKRIPMIHAHESYWNHTY